MMNEQLIQDLNNNFMYHASLASKELFHSNIIFWLLKLRSTEGELEVFKAFLESFELELDGMDLPALQKVEIEREKWNMDLVLTFIGDSTGIVVFENKVKSLVSAEQLADYDGKLGTKQVKGKVVLRLMEGANSYLSLPEGWVLRSYEKHLTRFLDLMEAMDFVGEGIEKQIIPEYRRFLGQLIQLGKSYKLSDSNESFSKSKYSFYSREEKGKLQQVRLHDFILKSVHARIASLISRKLENPEFFEIETGFTNTTGLNSIKLEVLGRFKIGVQLQGNNLRQFVESNDDDLAIHVARELVRREMWFWGGDIAALRGNGQKPKGKGVSPSALRISLESSSERRFCQYSNGSFLYLYKRVNELTEHGKELTVDELVGQMVGMMEQALSIKGEVAKLITAGP